MSMENGVQDVEMATESSCTTWNPFTEYKEVIEAGDLVILHLSRSMIQAIAVTPGTIIQNKFGNYHHTDMIGVKYGTQMKSKTTNGYIVLLHPTPELWTLALPHRTQILYAPDISFVIGKLAVRPGSMVFEAGTGSGSFTHAFLRTLGRQGYLRTYEFHRERCDKAREEFEAHGLFRDSHGKTLMTLTHRDVCKGGFQLDPSDTCKADAVFLDLPAPWEAIDHLQHHFAQTTRLCCFSPCIEQVQRTVAHLRGADWSEIECFEIAAREWEARYMRRQDIDDVIDNLREIKRRREAGVPRSDRQRLKIKDGDAAYEWERIAKAETEIRSHTSYLLFATKRIALSETT